jgi:hypothetical protein
MATGFRKPQTPDEFVGGAKTLTDQPVAPDMGQGRATPQPAPVALPQRPTQPSPDLFAEPLNPRIMKQVNFDMPEPDHFELKRLVDSIPRMSLRKFILEAIYEKIERLRASQR